MKLRAKKYQVDQHKSTLTHKSRTTLQASQPKQQLITANNDSNKSLQKTFNRDLCNVFVGCNIALYKLKMFLFQIFLVEYCGPELTIPSTSNLRKKYVDVCYTTVMESIKTEVKNNFIWFSVDESTDVKGRYIANFIIGSLVESGPSKGYLIGVKVLEKTNNATISRFVDKTL